MADLVLEVVEGPDAGTVFPLAGTLEIGSDEASGIRLADPHADAHHAVVEVGADGVTLTDLPPRGGTFVNHVELLASTRVVAGDEIQVGVTVLRLRPAGAAPVERPAPPELPAHPAPAPAREADMEEIDSLLDARTKRKARHAPLAVLVLVIYAVLIYLWTARY